MTSKPNPQGIKPVTRPRCKHCGAVITGYEFLRRIQNLYRVPRGAEAPTPPTATLNPS